MTKNACHVLPIGIRICSNRLRNPKWGFINLISVLSTFTKLQGCKEPFKIINVAFFGKYQIYLDRLKDSNQIKRNCVKTLDVRHDAKHYRAPQIMTGS